MVTYQIKQGKDGLYRAVIKTRGRNDTRNTFIPCTGYDTPEQARRAVKGLMQPLYMWNEQTYGS